MADKGPPMTPDPLPVALPELPIAKYTLATLGGDWEEPRITLMDGYDDDQMRAFAETALRAQAEEVAALRADAERLSFLQDWPGCNLISDDGGRWAVSETGFQPVAPDGGFKDTVGIQSLVFVHEWRDSVRGAIDAFIDSHSASKQENRP